MKRFAKDYLFIVAFVVVTRFLTDGWLPVLVLPMLGVAWHLLGYWDGLKRGAEIAHEIEEEEAQR